MNNRLSGEEESKAVVNKSRIYNHYYILYQRLLSHLRNPLYRNGYALTLSSLATSGIGMVYWILAAHRYTAQDIGINSAVLSAMMFLAGISELNLMSALIRFIPTAGRSTKRFVVTTYLVSLVLAAIISFIFIKMLPIWSPELRFLGENNTVAAWFILSTMIWTIFVLQDSVMTGLRQATWVFIENTVFSLAKIVLMLIFATSLPSLGIFASWSLALLIAVLPTNYFIFRKLIPLHIRSKEQENGRIELRQVVRFASADYLGALFWLVSTTLLPIIVTTVVGGTANAYFYLAWTIANALYLVSTSMGASLVVEAANDPQKLGIYSYQIFKNMAKLVVPTTALLLIAAPIVLMVFGRGYSSQGSTLLRLLALSAIPNIVNAIYVSVARVQRRTWAVVATLGSLCVLVLTLSYTLLKIYGIVGVGIGWLAGQTIVAGVVYITKLQKLWSKSKINDNVTRLRTTRGGKLPALIPAVYFVASRLGLLSLLKLFQKWWSTRQRRVNAQNLLPEVVKELPPEILNLSQDRWMVQHVAYTVTNTTVAFLGSQGQPPPIVLKLPGSIKDAQSQKKQYQVLASLYEDARLNGWRQLLPEVVAEGKAGEHVYFVERTLPGVTLRQFLRDPVAGQRVTNLAATAIRSLHRQTSTCVVIDDSLLQRWVRAPLNNLEQLASTGIISPHHQGAADRMAVELTEALSGNSVCTSWIHGDYSPSNILVDPTGSQITGIVDWDLARSDDLPLLDLIHLFLSIRMELQKREMGHVVRDLLLHKGWSAEELELIQEAQSDLPGNPVDLRHSLILGWLRHINANLIKTSRFDHHQVWLRENVVVVLESLHKSETNQKTGVNLG